MKKMNENDSMLSSGPPAMLAVIMPQKSKPSNFSSHFMINRELMRFYDIYLVPKNQIKQPKKKGAFSAFKKIKRVETDEPKVKKDETIDPGIGNSDIFYKFNSGYSNAVRQVIKIKELI